MYPRQSSLRRPLSPFLPSTPRMETEGPAPSDGEVGEHPDRLPSENRIGRRTDMEKTKNVRKRGLTPFFPADGSSLGHVNGGKNPHFDVFGGIFHGFAPP